jgi:extracellular matrix regulatory protein A
MKSALINVGFDNAVAVKKIVAVVSADALPIKRLRETALKNRKLVDATNGRRMRAVIVTDSDHIILSSLQPQTISQRLSEALDGEARGQQEP